MSTFAKSTFDSVLYLASRPTYPSRLYEHIFAYHTLGFKVTGEKARWGRAVDVGCGTGQATASLTKFQEVIGIDPSPGMLEKARKYLSGVTSKETFQKYSFLQGSGEDMRVADGSVDLLIAGQAAHWFDWRKVWPETSRVLRKGGTAAFWIYAEFRLTNYPSVTPIITSYVQGADPENSLGPHFERPGRTILERHLVDVPEPSEECGLEALERVYYCGDVPSFVEASSKYTHPVIMKQSMRWRDLLSYFRTFSSLHTYHERYPADLEREEDTRFLEQDLALSKGPTDDLRGGDIAIRFWKDLREGVLKSGPDAKVGPDEEVQVEWPVALLLTRKL